MILLPYLVFRQICLLLSRHLPKIFGWRFAEIKFNLFFVLETSWQALCRLYPLYPDILELVAVDEIDQLDPIVDADFVEDVVDMFFDCVGRYS